jgi:hypothetical protein
MTQVPLTLFAWDVARATILTFKSLASMMRCALKPFTSPSPSPVWGKATESVPAVDPLTAKSHEALPKSMPQMWEAILAAIEQSWPPEGKTTDNSKSKLTPFRLELQATTCNQTVTFSSKEVKAKMELDKAMGFKASAVIKATSLGPAVEAGNNLATQEYLNANDVKFLVHV